MNNHSLLADGEHMRLAVRWLSENAPITKKTIEDAGVRFDLSPLEVDFLLKEFLYKTDRGGK
jgi:hypothetical protein